MHTISHACKHTFIEMNAYICIVHVQCTYNLLWEAVLKMGSQYDTETYISCVEIR